ncbi:MAG TPA: LUD domain-containing protein [Clostridiales bacterium]|jgi:hypothetical protein|nr:LUD domain-containing protein [Clostridiales bacterium]
MVLPIETILANLSRRGFVAEYYETKEDALQGIMAQISPSETVGIGGSMTVKELGLFDELTKQGNTIFWHWTDKSGQDVRPKALLSDVYFCSANALMDSGEPVVIDGGGNRAAAMFYGPKRCFIVCGVNKLVHGYDAAIERIKNVACPQNARRLNMKTPCAITDKCTECGPKQRMCRVTVRYSYPMTNRETHVVLINEKLGF